MNEPTPIRREDVRVLARLAGLPLEEGREEQLAQLLSAWSPDAEALSSRLAAEEFRHVLPITVLSHPGAADESELS